MIFAHLEDVLVTFPLAVDPEEYRERWWEGLAEFLAMHGEALGEVDAGEHVEAALAAFEALDITAVLEPLLLIRSIVAPPDAPLGQVGRMLHVTPGEAVTLVTASMMAGHMSPQRAGEAMREILVPTLAAALPAGQTLHVRNLPGPSEDRARASAMAFQALELAALPERTP